MPQCLFSSDRIMRQIYRHSGFSATIASSFSSPSTDPRGINIYEGVLYSVDYDSQKIYKHCGISGNIVSSFSSPSTDPRHICFYNDDLYSLDYSSKKVYRHSGFSLTISSSFSSPSISPLGLIYDDNFLYTADLYTDKIYRHSGFTSNIRYSFAATDRYDFAHDGINIYTLRENTKIYQHSGFSSTINDSFSAPYSDTYSIAIGWYPSENTGNVALTDGGFNDAEFNIDYYNETEISFDQYERTTSGNLKQYEVSNKKRIVLRMKNISSTDKDSLKTLYDLRKELFFYRDATDRNYTAKVMWKGNFDFHTPTRKSYQFLDRLYEGTIILEEI